MGKQIRLSLMALIVAPVKPIDRYDVCGDLDVNDQRSQHYLVLLPVYFA
jgi:hypothetical protein